MTIQIDPSTRRGRRQRWRSARQRGLHQLKTSLLSCLGPGLITGASDDDPSGIATYSQAGAQFGFSLLWSMVFTIPLMAAFQEICARLGRITGRGLARNMRLNYSAWIVDPLVLLLVVTNILNLGADINAMGDALAMLIGGPRVIYAIGFTLASLMLQIFASYKHYTGILKWLATVLLFYVAATFAVRPHWRSVVWATFVPPMSFSGDYFAVLVAVLGTTISPYLFFWQASLEAEETRITPGEESLLKSPERSRAEFRRIRLDTAFGMILSNFIGFCIMVCAAATLHVHNITTITSADQAAQALGPIAPPLLIFGDKLSIAPLLFAMGIIGGGLLAIPVLAGSAAYAVGEVFRWPVGMDRRVHKAKGFYGVLVVATLLGAGMTLTSLNPMKMLVWAAIANGVAAVPIMVLIMLMFSNRRVMGRFVQISKPLRITGWLATAAMTAAAIGMFATLGK